MNYIIKSFAQSIVGVKLFMDFTYINGKRTPITGLKLGPCVILNVEGGIARVLFFKVQCLNKSLLNGNFSKTHTLLINKVRGNVQFNRLLYSNLFKVGDFIDISSKSKGKGFQGVIKRWSFSKQPKSHGSMSHRRGGSFGNREWPAEIQKGKKMPGHLGGIRNSVQNLEIVSAFPYNNIVFVRGSVSGFPGTLIYVKFSKKKYCNANVRIK